MVETWFELRMEVSQAIPGNHAETTDQHRNCKLSNAQPEIPTKSCKVSNSPGFGEI